MNAEIQRPRIDLEAIAAAYDYSPLPEGYVQPEKIDLGISLESVRAIVIPGISNAAKAFVSGNKYSECFLLASNLKLQISVGDKSLGRQLMCFSLTDFVGNEIGSFYLDHREKEWEVVHRYVIPEFRDQGIGSEMLTILEAVILEYGKQEEKDQICRFTVSQLGVAVFIMNNGYEPEAEEDFLKFLESLGSGDQKFVIYTYCGDVLEPWYVLNKEEFESDGCIESSGQYFTFTKVIKTEVAQSYTGQFAQKVNTSL